MMKHSKWMILVTLLAVSACKKDEARQIDTSYNPEILAANFTSSTVFTNPYFQLEPGKKYIYEGQTSDGFEHIEITLLSTTRSVMGIACAVVSDKVWINNEK